MLEGMQNKTLDFISSLNGFFEKNIINKKSLVIFDEAEICVNESLPVVTDEHRDSGGENINVIQTRQSAPFCYIRFSLGDGTTPFPVVV